MNKFKEVVNRDAKGINAQEMELLEDDCKELVEAKVREIKAAVKAAKRTLIRAENVKEIQKNPASWLDNIIQAERSLKSSEVDLTIIEVVDNKWFSEKNLAPVKDS